MNYLISCESCMNPEFAEGRVLRFLSVHDLDKKIFGRCIVNSWVLMIRCVKFCFGFKRLLCVETLSLAFDMKVMATKVAETLPVFACIVSEFFVVKDREGIVVHAPFC